MPNPFLTSPDLSAEVAELRRQVARLYRLLGRDHKNDNCGFTISEFCRAERISRSFYYVLRKRGEGPRELHAGARVIITPKAKQDWEIERETARKIAAVSQIEPAAQSSKISQSDHQQGAARRAAQESNYKL
jgi:hypothetical protein